MSADPYPPTLGPAAVYVSAAAGVTFADAIGQPSSGREAAFRYLTAILVEHAKLVRSEGDVGLYRARSRQTQLDVTARVVREGPLYVVVSCHVREYR